MPAFQDLTVTSLTANQAGGIDPVLAADTTRNSLIVANPNAVGDMYLGIGAGSVTAANRGLPLPANSAPLAFGQGSPCPGNAIYVFGTAGQRLTLWVA